MVTKERKRALQWFHDRGEVRAPKAHSMGADPWGCAINGVYAPSCRMIALMVNDGSLDFSSEKYTLTDKGRRVLHDG